MGGGGRHVGPIVIPLVGSPWWTPEQWPWARVQQMSDKATMADGSCHHLTTKHPSLSHHRGLIQGVVETGSGAVKSSPSFGSLGA